MKKFLISILAFVYLLSIIAVTIQQHYCMNKLVGWSFFQQNKDMCDECGMEKNDQQNGCCKDVITKVKSENEQFKSIVSILFEKKETLHLHEYYIYEPGLKKGFSKKYLSDHGPPCSTSVSLFILNKVFLI